MATAAGAMAAPLPPACRSTLATVMELQGRPRRPLVSVHAMLGSMPAVPAVCRPRLLCPPARQPPPHHHHHRWPACPTGLPLRPGCRRAVGMAPRRPQPQWFVWGLGVAGGDAAGAARALWRRRQRAGLQWPPPSQRLGHAGGAATLPQRAPGTLRHASRCALVVGHCPASLLMRVFCRVARRRRQRGGLFDLTFQVFSR